MFEFRLYEVPVFEIAVVQGSLERVFGEFEATTLIIGSDRRPTLQCNGCRAVVSPTRLFNLNRRSTDGALDVYCRSCVEAAAEARNIPSDVVRWYRLTNTLEHALQGFEEARNRVLDHNRQVREVLARREAEELARQRKLARTALAVARSFLRRAEERPLNHASRRAAAHAKSNGWNALKTA